jgi:hypothetical protein
VYQDLADTVKIQKLYYQRGQKNSSLVFSPSFLIGKDSNGDLVGFVSYRWSDTGLSDSVLVNPFYWHREFVQFSEPDVYWVLSENKLLDSLVCQLDTIYRCEW